MYDLFTIFRYAVNLRFTLKPFTAEATPSASTEGRSAYLVHPNFVLILPLLRELREPQPAPQLLPL